MGLALFLLYFLFLCNLALVSGFTEVFSIAKDVAENSYYVGNQESNFFVGKRDRACGFEWTSTDGSTSGDDDNDENNEILYGVIVADDGFLYATGSTRGNFTAPTEELPNLDAAVVVYDPSDGRALRQKQYDIVASFDNVGRAIVQKPDGVLLIAVYGSLSNVENAPVFETRLLEIDQNTLETQNVYTLTVTTTEFFSVSGGPKILDFIYDVSTDSVVAIGYILGRGLLWRYNLASGSVTAQAEWGTAFGAYQISGFTTDGAGAFYVVGSSSKNVLGNVDLSSTDSSTFHAYVIRYDSLTNMVTPATWVRQLQALGSSQSGSDITIDPVTGELVVIGAYDADFEVTDSQTSQTFKVEAVTSNGLTDVFVWVLEPSSGNFSDVRRSELASTASEDRGNVVQVLSDRRLDIGGVINDGTDGNPLVCDDSEVASPSPTPSVTPSASPTPTPSQTSSTSPSPSITPSPTSTPSVTPSISISSTTTMSLSPSPTPSASPTLTPSQTSSPSPSPAVTPSPTPTSSVTPSISISSAPSMSLGPSPLSSVTTSDDNNDSSPLPSLEALFTFESGSPSTSSQIGEQSGSFAPNVSQSAPSPLTGIVSASVAPSLAFSASAGASLVRESASNSFAVTATVGSSPRFSEGGASFPVPSESVVVNPTISASVGSSPGIRELPTASPVSTKSAGFSPAISISASSSATMSEIAAASPVATQSVLASPLATPEASTSAAAINIENADISPTTSNSGKTSLTPSSPLQESVLSTPQASIGPIFSIIPIFTSGEVTISASFTASQLDSSPLPSLSVQSSIPFASTTPRASQSPQVSFIRTPLETVTGSGLPDTDADALLFSLPPSISQFLPLEQETPDPLVNFSLWPSMQVSHGFEVSVFPSMMPSLDGSPVAPPGLVLPEASGQQTIVKRESPSFPIEASHRMEELEESAASLPTIDMATGEIDFTPLFSLQPSWQEIPLLPSHAIELPTQLTEEIVPFPFNQLPKIEESPRSRLGTSTENFPDASTLPSLPAVHGEKQETPAPIESPSGGSRTPILPVAALSEAPFEGSPEKERNPSFGFDGMLLQQSALVTPEPSLDVLVGPSPGRTIPPLLSAEETTNPSFNPSPNWPISPRIENSLEPSSFFFGHSPLESQLLRTPLPLDMPSIISSTEPLFESDRSPTPPYPLEPSLIYLVSPSLFELEHSAVPLPSLEPVFSLVEPSPPTLQVPVLEPSLIFFVKPSPLTSQPTRPVLPSLDISHEPITFWTEVPRREFSESLVPVRTPPFIDVTEVSPGPFVGPLEPEVSPRPEPSAGLFVSGVSPEPEPSVGPFVPGVSPGQEQFVKPLVPEASAGQQPFVPEISPKPETIVGPVVPEVSPEPGPSVGPLEPEVSPRPEPSAGLFVSGVSPEPEPSAGLFVSGVSPEPEPSVGPFVPGVSPGQEQSVKPSVPEASAGQQPFVPEISPKPETIVGPVAPEVSPEPGPSVGPLEPEVSPRPEPSAGLFVSGVSPEPEPSAGLFVSGVSPEPEPSVGPFVPGVSPGQEQFVKPSVPEASAGQQPFIPEISPKPETIVGPVVPEVSPEPGLSVGPLEPEVSPRPEPSAGLFVSGVSPEPEPSAGLFVSGVSPEPEPSVGPFVPGVSPGQEQSVEPSVPEASAGQQPFVPEISPKPETIVGPVVPEVSPEPGLSVGPLEPEVSPRPEPSAGLFVSGVSPEPEPSAGLFVSGVSPEPEPSVGPFVPGVSPGQEQSVEPSVPEASAGQQPFVPEISPKPETIVGPVVPEVSPEPGLSVGPLEPEVSPRPEPSAGLFVSGVSPEPEPSVVPFAPEASPEPEPSVGPFIPRVSPGQEQFVKPLVPEASAGQQPFIPEISPKPETIVGPVVPEVSPEPGPSVGPWEPEVSPRPEPSAGLFVSGVSPEPEPSVVFFVPEASLEPDPYVSPFVPGVSPEREPFVGTVPPVKPSAEIEPESSLLPVLESSPGERKLVPLNSPERSSQEIIEATPTVIEEFDPSNEPRKDPTILPSTSESPRFSKAPDATRDIDVGPTMSALTSSSPIVTVLISSSPIVTVLISSSPTVTVIPTKPIVTAAPLVITKLPSFTPAFISSSISNLTASSIPSPSRIATPSSVPRVPVVTFSLFPPSLTPSVSIPASKTTSSPSVEEIVTNPQSTTTVSASETTTPSPVAEASITNPRLSPTVTASETRTPTPSFQMSVTNPQPSGTVTTLIPSSSTAFSSTLDASPSLLPTLASSIRPTSPIDESVSPPVSKAPVNPLPSPAESQLVPSETALANQTVLFSFSPSLAGMLSSTPSIVQVSAEIEPSQSADTIMTPTALRTNFASPSMGTIEASPSSLPSPSLLLPSGTLSGTPRIVQGSAEIEPSQSADTFMTPTAFKTNSASPSATTIEVSPSSLPSRSLLLPLGNLSASPSMVQESAEIELLQSAGTILTPTAFRTISASPSIATIEVSPSSLPNPPPPLPSSVASATFNTLATPSSPDDSPSQTITVTKNPSVLPIATRTPTPSQSKVVSDSISASPSVSLLETTPEVSNIPEPSMLFMSAFPSPTWTPRIERSRSPSNATAGSSFPSVVFLSVSPSTSLVTSPVFSSLVTLSAVPSPSAFTLQSLVPTGAIRTASVSTTPSGSLVAFGNSASPSASETKDGLGTLTPSPVPVASASPIPSGSSVAFENTASPSAGEATDGLGTSTSSPVAMESEFPSPFSTVLMTPDVFESPDVSPRISLSSLPAASQSPSSSAAPSTSFLLTTSPGLTISPSVTIAPDVTAPGVSTSPGVTTSPKASPNNVPVFPCNGTDFVQDSSELSPTNNFQRVEMTIQIAGPNVTNACGLSRDIAERFLNLSAVNTQSSAALWFVTLIEDGPAVFSRSSGLVTIEDIDQASTTVVNDTATISPSPSTGKGNRELFSGSVVFHVTAYLDPLAVRLAKGSYVVYIDSQNIVRRMKEAGFDDIEWTGMILAPKVIDVRTNEVSPPKSKGISAGGIGAVSAMTAMVVGVAILIFKDGVAMAPTAGAAGDSPPLADIV